MNMETKKEIRKRMLDVRKGLTKDEVKSKGNLIIQKVLKTPEYDEADNVLIYADYCNEVGTQPIFEDALLRGKRVYYPKSDKFTNTMEFYRITSLKQLESGYMGILEPRENESLRYRLNRKEDTLIIVPGVAFDISGYRLGYGKGFYDRFLVNKRQISTMALAYSCQIVDELPHDTYDIKMDKIVTEEIIYSFLRV
jgi:5-formyltetrahydrofolate cyclo-ligase